MTQIKKKVFNNLDTFRGAKNLQQLSSDDYIDSLHINSLFYEKISQ